MKGDGAREEMVNAACKQLTLLEVKRLNEAAAEERRRKAMAIEKKEKLENKGNFYTNDTPEGWTRGTNIDLAKNARKEEDARFNQGRKPRETGEGESTGNWGRGEALKGKEEGGMSRPMREDRP